MKRPFFHIITLFPETVLPWLTTSILGRAEKAGLFGFKIYQLRDFATDKHKSVDDVAYGGGGGMVLKVEPLVSAVETIKANSGNMICVYFSPAGKTLHQSLIQEYSTKENQEYILVCGHYEGVDQRFIDHWVDLEISLGDFVVTGGELPALAFIDSLVRQLDGTLAEGAALQESFQKSLLEYPHYSRPQEFRGLKVPPVLVGGDHGLIAEWRENKSQERTLQRRPDLFDKVNAPHS